MSSKSIQPHFKYSLKILGWHFRPTLKLSIITLLLFGVLIYLGVWQINRANEKKNMLVALQNKSQQPAKNISLIADPSLEHNRFERVVVDGVFLNNYTFLLDNQMLNHQPGFRVLTPLQTPLLDKWLLIDLGWVPLGKSRNEVPQLAMIFGVKNITGIINTISSGIVLHNDKADPNTKWPSIIQSLDYAHITKQLKHPVYEFVVQIPDSDIKHYLYPPLDYGFSSDKNWGYALQWFLFASLLLVYYLIATIKRSK